MANPESKKGRILDIVRGTTVDGPGFRTSIYFAGCDHKCKGCHNPESWDFNAGHEMSVDELLEIINEEDFDVTLSGGDPLYQMDFAISLCKAIKDAGYKIWVYTGFRIEELSNNKQFASLAKYIDVLVDSPFIESEKDPDLVFRGSRNQRIIRLND